eukprot:gene3552-13623_t
MNETPSPRFAEGRKHSPWTASRQRKKNRPAACQQLLVSSDDEFSDGKENAADQETATAPNKQQPIFWPGSVAMQSPHNNCTDKDILGNSCWVNQANDSRVSFRSRPCSDMSCERPLPKRRSPRHSVKHVISPWAPTPPSAAVSLFPEPSTAPPLQTAAFASGAITPSVHPAHSLCLSELPPKHLAPWVQQHSRGSNTFSLSPAVHQILPSPAPFPDIGEEHAAPSFTAGFGSRSAAHGPGSTPGVGLRSSAQGPASACASDSADFGSLACSESLSSDPDVSDLEGAQDSSPSKGDGAMGFMWGSMEQEEEEHRYQLQPEGSWQRCREGGNTCGFQLSTVVGPSPASSAHTMATTTPMSELAERASRSLKRLSQRKAKLQFGVAPAHGEGEAQAEYGLLGDLACCESLQEAATMAMLLEADFVTPPKHGKHTAHAALSVTPTLFSEWLSMRGGLSTGRDSARGGLSLAQHFHDAAETTDQGEFGQGPPSCQPDASDSELHMWGAGKGSRDMGRDVHNRRDNDSRMRSPQRVLPVEQLCTLEDFNSQLCMAAITGNCGHASVLWAELCNKGINPDLKTLNTLMRCQSKSLSHPDVAEALAREVCEVGCLSPNATTYNLLTETRFRYEQLFGN